MKKFLRICLTLALVMVLALAFTGCNFSVKPPEKDPDIVLPDNPDAKQVLKVSTLSGKEERNTMLAWARGYMLTNKDVKIIVNDNLTSMNDIEKWYHENTMPDICWTAGDQHSYCSSLGCFEDLSTLAIGDDEAFFEDFYPSLIETTHLSDKDKGIWFMPRDYNQLTVFINKTLFAEAKIALPTAEWTWADFEQICADWKAYKPEKKYYSCEMDFTWTPQAITMMANSDAKIYTDGKLTANSPEMRSCLEKLNKMIVEKNYYAQGGGSFNMGFSPMSIGVRPALPLSMKALANNQMELVTMPYPSTTTTKNKVGYVGAGCSGYAISSKSKEETKLLAWDFLKYCMSKDGYEIVGKEGTIVPALQSLSNSGSWTEYKDENGNAFNYQAFNAGLAEPISVNCCSNLKPVNQSMANLKLMLLFGDTQYPGFNFNTSIKTFTDAVRNFT